MGKTFNPNKLKRYERGDVIKVNLGFNIGSEEGGMHYAVVLDNKNKLNSGIMTIIPLTSKKEGREVHSDDVDLGMDLYIKLNAKYETKIKEQMLRGLNNLKKDPDLVKKMEAEIFQLKTGSIALISQITTISKLRIFDPRNSGGVLSGIKLSNDNLDAIDEKINELFMKQ